jgi:heme/copper-type cytochrome/quinol oxidase subunit 1
VLFFGHPEAELWSLCAFGIAVKVAARGRRPA